MAKVLDIKHGEDKIAVVRRIVPGKLVYVDVVDTKSKDEEISPYPIKLDQVIIRKRDGSCYPYRGEPLSELGINVGKKVVVWGTDYPETLVIDSGTFSTSFGSTLSHVASRTADYLKR